MVGNRLVELSVQNTENICLIPTLNVYHIILMGHRCSGKMPNAMPAAAAKDPRTELDWDGHADGLLDSWTHGP